MSIRYHLEVKIEQGTFEYKYIPANSLEQLHNSMPREVLSYTVIRQVDDPTISPVNDDDLALDLIYMISNLEHSALRLKPTIEGKDCCKAPALDWAFGITRARFSRLIDKVCNRDGSSKETPFVTGILAHGHCSWGRSDCLAGYPICKLGEKH